MADTWATIATTWATETQKWDVIDFSFTGTLVCRVTLNSPKAMGLAFAGTQNLEVELNSPPDFPQIQLDGTLSMQVTLNALVDYALWTEEASVSKAWTKETSS